MKTWMAGTTCAAVAFSLSLVTTATAAAQQSPQSSPGSQSRSEPSQATLSGCVVRDAANSGRPTIIANGVSYMLIGKPDARLDQYLGKRVEVTGTLERGSPRATTGDANATGTDKRPPAVPLATRKGTTADLTGRAQVKSIRIVAPTCLTK